ncbi:hypothetical protein LUZ60_013186 [Juncus effusus]|nr:hypothetical protein LUZ60_013186 [Juncus effusus]
MDHSEPPRWHHNSSFSPLPPLPFPDGSAADPLHQVTAEVANFVGSSLGSRSGQFGSVSDGAGSYFGSPAESRWTPSLLRFDLGEFSTPSGSVRPETLYPRSTERHLTSTSSIGSASPLYPPPHQRFSGRRSFMSKPVYPLAFLNPVSTPSEPDSWPLSPKNPESQLPDSEIPDLGSRDLGSGSRHGFRWSNASSSYDFDGAESVDIQMDAFNAGSNPVRSQNKCGICERMLWQKSPWSSSRIVRNGDMPICGVLPCRHVYHADCLEESAVKGERSDEPACPVCDQRGSSSGNGSGPVTGLEVQLVGNENESSSKVFRSRFLKKGFGSIRGRIGRVFKRVGSSSKNPRDDRGDPVGGAKK